MEPIPADGGSEVDGYNDELRLLGPLTWLAAPWLFAEYYIYRLVHTFFSTSTPFWQAHDIFFVEKKQSLVASHVGVFEIVKRFAAILQSFKDVDEPMDDHDSSKILFDEMIQVALWGNATDLTLLKSLSAEEMQSRQGRTAREISRASIVVNDAEKVWHLLSALKAGSSPTSGSIHIVLDNSSFELLADLALASYLLENKFASKVVLHGKVMPWFVSDVNARDLESLVGCFVDATYTPNMSAVERQEIKSIGAYWPTLFNQGKMTFRAHSFWTTQHSFGRMAVIKPGLFDELTQGDLVIFKGDLNYRKLTYDGKWPKTTLFSQALGTLAKPQNGKAVRVLVLRTCKADVCVGLSPGQEEKLEDGWTRYGHYGVVSYWDGKSCID